MQNKIVFSALASCLFIFAACGNGKNMITPPKEEVSDETTELVESIADSVLEEDKEIPVVMEDESEFTLGIIRDLSKFEGCGFMIEIKNENGENRLLEPFELDAQFNKDGLKIKFSYTQSRRPSLCTEPSTPITINSIEVI